MTMVRLYPKNLSPQLISTFQIKLSFTMQNWQKGCNKAAQKGHADTVLVLYFHNVIAVAFDKKQIVNTPVNKTFKGDKNNPNIAGTTMKTYLFKLA